MALKRVADTLPLIFEFILVSRRASYLRRIFGCKSKWSKYECRSWW